MTLPILDRAATGGGPDAADGQQLLDADDVRLLVEAGFMALMRGFLTAAADLFTGVVAARPAGEAGYVGLALVQLHRGEVDAAVTILRRLPPSDTVRLFLGTALQRRGDVTEAREILSDLADTAPGTSQAQSAEALLAAMGAEARP